jgi:uncharacterized membrane protein
MMWLTTIFAHVCGQGRCFVADGAALPICERCTGLYWGALLTALWLLAGGVWRCGLPSYGVVATHAAALIIALLGGTHVLDYSPAWRLLCGLWTGHVAMLWLTTGTTQLRARATGRSAESVRWPRGQTCAAYLALPAAAVLAGGFVALAPNGWWLWSGGCAAGALLLGLAAMRAIAALRPPRPAARRPLPV